MRDKHSEREQGGAASEGARKAPQTDHLGYARLLGRIDLFMGLERVTLAKLAAHIEPLFYPSHSIIFLALGVIPNGPRAGDDAAALVLKTVCKETGL
jgi:hypothetical protein